MLLSTCTAFWEPVRDSLLPPAVVLLNATVLWAVFRLRSISKDVQWTSSAQEATLLMQHQLLGHNGLPAAVPARRKSSTKGTTSTSRGERE